MGQARKIYKPWNQIMSSENWYHCQGPLKRNTSGKLWLMNKNPDWDDEFYYFSPSS